MAWGPGESPQGKSRVTRNTSNNLPVGVTKKRREFLLSRVGQAMSTGVTGQIGNGGAPDAVLTGFI